jgi:hypothetical protein
MKRPHLHADAYRSWADAGVRDLLWRGQLFLYAHIVVGTALAGAIDGLIGGDRAHLPAGIAAITVYALGPIALLFARRRSG